MRFWTNAGLELHKKKINQLEEKLDELGVRIGEACAETSETFHDNACFEIVRHDQSIVDRQLTRAYALLTDLQIREYPATISDCKVCYGSKVNFVMNSGVEQYWIVGYGHNSSEHNRVLYDSPLAQCMIGHREFDSFSLDLRQKIQIVTVLKVEPIPIVELEKWAQELENEIKI